MNVLDQRRQDIEQLVAQNQLDRAHKRLLDFVTDFGSSPKQRRSALVLGSKLTALKQKIRYGESSETLRLQAELMEEILEMVDEVAPPDGVESQKGATIASHSLQPHSMPPADEAKNETETPPSKKNRHKNKKTKDKPQSTQTMSISSTLPTFSKLANDIKSRRREKKATREDVPSLSSTLGPQTQPTEPEEIASVATPVASEEKSKTESQKTKRRDSWEPDPTAVYSCFGLAKTYRKGRHFRLHDVEINLHPGEVTGLVGVNGAGKTTLLRMIAGELYPTEGQFGYPSIQPRRGRKAMFFWSEVRKQIGYVEQRPAKWFGRLAENLYLESALKGNRGRKGIEDVDFILQRLGLDEYRDMKWTQISGGYKMRFELARILVTKPKLLVLDEPLAPLDILAQQLFLEDIRDITKSERFPVATIISSQHLYEVERVSDRLLFIDGGEVKFNGPVSELGKRRPDNVFEIGCDVTLDKLSEELEHLNFECEQAIHGYFMIRTPLEVSAAKVLEALVQRKIEVRYFRDVSCSARTLFNQSTLPSD